MTFKAAKCPNCAGDIQVPDEHDTAKCMYCGGDIIVREAINLAAAGINLENIFRLADEAVNSGNHAEAYNYYTKILETDPNNYKAWHGKAISAGWQSTLANLRLPETISGIENALKNAPENEKNELKEKAALSLNQLAIAIYNLAYNNFTSYITRETHRDFILRMKLLTSILEKAADYKPDDKDILENIIFLTQAYMKPHTNNITCVECYLSDPSYKAAENKIRDVSIKIQQLEPSYRAQMPSQKSACFIATATYASPMSPEVLVLRSFRDDYLKTTEWGKTFIKYYYLIGPHIASLISKSERLRTLMRFLLKPIIYLIKKLRKKPT